MKGLLTSLEKTPSLTRPTSPLTGPRFAASWCWAQGSCELPTAKPRMRSPYLRSETPSLINSALVGVRHSHLKADPLAWIPTEEECPNENASALPENPGIFAISASWSLCGSKSYMGGSGEVTIVIINYAFGDH